jgi:putative resolvase
MMSRLVTIGEAAEALGVSVPTLRRWENQGRLTPDERTPGGQRRYDLARLRPELYRAANNTSRKTVAYARVASHDLTGDLERQKQLLDVYCGRQGWTYEIIADLGSGVNDHNKGLRRLLSDIIAGHVGRLVVTQKDRLLRLGGELVFAVCEAKEVEVVILNQGAEATVDEDLAGDVREMIAIFSARLYGSRSRKHQKLLSDIKQAVEAFANA